VWGIGSMCVLGRGSGDRPRLWVPRQWGGCVRDCVPDDCAIAVLSERGACASGTRLTTKGDDMVWRPSRCVASFWLSALVQFLGACGRASSESGTTPSVVLDSSPMAASSDGAYDADGGLPDSTSGATSGGSNPLEAGLASADAQQDQGFPMRQLIDGGTCHQPWGTCDGFTCTTLASDHANCGFCGNACPVGLVCSGGKCLPTCASGTSSCSGSCVNLSYDIANCGSCDRACGSGERCVNSACVCNQGTEPALCNGRCVDLANDFYHCGSCAHDCGIIPPHVPHWVCSARQCKVWCDPGLTDCGGVCVDTMTDNSNCAGCANSCVAPLSCIDGACSCPSGQNYCGAMCVSLSNDPNNCGACGIQCTAGVPCTNGQCTCATGSLLCGGSCVDGHSDKNNCGFCGAVCGGNLKCQDGVCTCPPPFTDCAGECVNTSIDNTNCGSCGTSCSSPSTCQNSVCL
jgi:hypothetical protein